MDADLEKAETKLADAKAAQQEGDQSKTISEGLQRKIQLLEEELDAADKNLKDAMEKCVVAVPPCARGTRTDFATYRLRQVDVKAEHFERQVQRLEQERDQWEKKYEVRDACRHMWVCWLSDCQICRKPKRSTASRKPNWTSSSPTWKAFNLSTVFCGCLTRIPSAELLLRFIASIAAHGRDASRSYTLTYLTIRVSSSLSTYYMHESNQSKSNSTMFGVFFQSVQSTAHRDLDSR